MLILYFVGKMKAIIKKDETVQWFGGDCMVSTYDEMIERTKEKIQNSFLQLLKEKPFMKVSVRDITTVALINRGTFYLHYVDKYDLLDQIEGNLLGELELHLQRLKPEVLLLEAEKGQISTLAVEVFRYIQTNAELFQVLLGENNHFGFHKRLKLFFISHFAEKMVQNKEFFQGLTVPRDYLSSFATSAFLGLIEQWLDNSLAETPEEMADMYIQIIFFIRKM
jgi:AcrR family transcriptional regulator